MENFMQEKGDDAVKKALKCTETENNPEQERIMIVLGSDLGNLVVEIDECLIKHQQWEHHHHHHQPPPSSRSSGTEETIVVSNQISISIIVITESCYALAPQERKEKSEFLHLGLVLCWVRGPGGQTWQAPPSPATRFLYFYSFN